ncbi:Rossmann-like and DUF2520 domain-containing protein [Dyadobacter sandarakinus]|uniref:DUF2520 domain-containing protein n=1 Tax=Dyadobacter sandarakinus TaxID=2747268 RepID=A0ABX7ICC4_9BACT|nr:Rossmann-like and DUF2520 domain-containing protein [Dyadobacter sandarakinus]QRR03117.1 DUF2520 domain-containing protein [Dyadobacter sandarakinus]
MKISFIGAGNVAWHLAQAFENAGHWICEVYSRNPDHARLLASSLYDTNVQPDLNFSESEAELIIIAVSDDAIEHVIEQIVLPENAILAHTSGTRSLAEFQKLVEVYSDVYVHTGVFYPLQTFTKGVEMYYREIPFCIESRNELIESRLIKLAESISDSVTRMDSDERFILHVGAVFASNFTNYLFTVSHNLLEREQISFELLKPLIRTTVNKVLLAVDPAPGQTGPARRGDWKTTSRHLEYLQETNQDWIEIYRVLTDKIRDFYIAK